MEVFQILDEGLYQSGGLVDHSWRDLGITVVVDLEGNLDLTIPTEANSIIYVYYPIDDGPLPDVAVIRHIAHFVSQMLDQGRKVLTHCVTGETMVGSTLPSPLLSATTTLSADGKIHTIRAVVGRSVSSILEIKARGTLPIQCTPDHEFLVFQSYRRPNGVTYPRCRWHTANSSLLRAWNAKQPIWLKADEVRVGDYLLSPRWQLERDGESAIDWILRSQHKNAKSVSPLLLSKDVAWLLGLYAADGSSRGKYGIGLTLSPSDDIERAVRTFKRLGLHPTTKDYGTHIRIGVNSVNVTHSFVEWLGEGSTTKRLPPFIFNKTLAQSVIAGVLAGDGSYRRRETGSTTSVLPVTTSLPLAFQIWQLAIALGKHAYIRPYRRHSGYPNASPAWSVEWNDGATFHYTTFLGDFYAMPITSVKRLNGKHRVYSPEVDEEPTYLTQGVLSHNCAAGCNRSGLVNGRVLIERGMTGAEAVQRIRERRGSCALGNTNFAEWLLQGG